MRIVTLDSWLVKLRLLAFASAVAAISDALFVFPSISSIGSQGSPFDRGLIIEAFASMRARVSWIVRRVVVGGVGTVAV